MTQPLPPFMHPITGMVCEPAACTEDAVRASLIEAARGLATALASRVLREASVAFSFDASWPVMERMSLDLDLD